MKREILPLVWGLGPFHDPLRFPLALKEMRKRNSAESHGVGVMLVLGCGVVWGTSVSKYLFFGVDYLFKSSLNFSRSIKSSANSSPIRHSRASSSWT